MGPRPALDDLRPLERAHAVGEDRARDPREAALEHARDGESFSVGGFTIRDRRIVAMDILADPERLGRLDLTILVGCRRRSSE